MFDLFGNISPPKVEPSKGPDPNFWFEQPSVTVNADSFESLDGEDTEGLPLGDTGYKYIAKVHVTTGTEIFSIYLLRSESYFWLREKYLPEKIKEELELAGLLGVKPL